MLNDNQYDNQFNIATMIAMQNAMAMDSLRTQIELGQARLQQQALQSDILKGLRDSINVTSQAPSSPARRVELIFNRRTNCRNCGAPLLFDKCDYCDTINR